MVEGVMVGDTAMVVAVETAAEAAVEGEATAG